MSILRPRSVLQLVLVGFCAAFAPLIIATLFTLQTLDKLAINHRQSSALLVEVTRLAQEIDSDVRDLERRAGQYYALVDPALAELFHQERADLVQKLKNLQGRIQLQGPEIIQLSKSVEGLQLETIDLVSRQPFNTPSMMASLKVRVFLRTIHT